MPLSLEIIIDDSFKNTKAECIYNKLGGGSSTFKNMIKKFDGDVAVSNLKFTINNRLSSTNYGRTVSPENNSGIITIQINDNAIKDISNLGSALVFVHEGNTCRNV